MNHWFYAHAGEKHGPVSEEQLAELAKTEKFDPSTDLVWREGMQDWQKANEIPELQLTHASHPDAQPENPYSPPLVEELKTTSSALDPSNPFTGPHKLNVKACISRAFILTKRHFGSIFIIGLTYIMLSFLINAAVGVIDAKMGIQTPNDFGEILTPSSTDMEAKALTLTLQIVSFIINVASSIFSLFLALGLTRCGLNLISGQPAQPEMLFSQGRKLLSFIGASILMFIIISIGLLFLILPGIYLALRLSYTQAAIVDQNLGPIQALAYSFKITQGNGLKIFYLNFLMFIITFAGILALFLGLIFTIPVVILAQLLTYRWLQQGEAAVNENPALA